MARDCSNARGWTGVSRSGRRRTFSEACGSIRSSSADRIAAAWLRRQAIAAAACGAHDTNGMYDMDDANKNISVSGLRRPRDRTSTGLGCCWCALSSAKHLGGAGDACVRDVMVLVVVVQLVLLVCGLVERSDAYK